MTRKAAPNPKLFRELSAPFASADEANKAIQTFLDELSELRKKHKIPTVYVITNLSFLTETGKEAMAIMPNCWGDMLRMESLTAWAYAYETAQREQTVANALADGKKVRP